MGRGPASDVLENKHLNTAMEDSGSNRRLLHRWELFLLIAAIFILLYFILQRFGIDVVHVVEESEIIDHPHR